MSLVLSTQFKFYGISNIFCKTSIHTDLTLSMNGRYKKKYKSHETIVSNYKFSLRKGHPKSTIPSTDTKKN